MIYGFGETWYSIYTACRIKQSSRKSGLNAKEPLSTSEHTPANVIFFATAATRIHYCSLFYHVSFASASSFRMLLHPLAMWDITECQKHRIFVIDCSCVDCGTGEGITCTKHQAWKPVGGMTYGCMGRAVLRGCSGNFLAPHKDT